MLIIKREISGNTTMIAWFCSQYLLICKATLFTFENMYSKYVFLVPTPAHHTSSRNQAWDSARVGGQDRKIPPAPRYNQIAGLVKFRPPLLNQMLNTPLSKLAAILVFFTLRAEHLFVFFFTEEEKSRLCPNHVNSLKPPQPGLLD